MQRLEDMSGAFQTHDASVGVAVELPRTGKTVYNEAVHVLISQNEFFATFLNPQDRIFTTGAVQMPKLDRIVHLSLYVMAGEKNSIKGHVDAAAMLLERAVSLRTLTLGIMSISYRHSYLEKQDWFHRSMKRILSAVPSAVDITYASPNQLSANVGALPEEIGGIETRAAMLEKDPSDSAP